MKHIKKISITGIILLISLLFNLFNLINIAIAKNINKIDTEISTISNIFDNVNPPVRYFCCNTFYIKTCICIFC